MPTRGSKTELRQAGLTAIDHYRSAGCEIAQDFLLLRVSQAYARTLRHYKNSFFVLWCLRKLLYRHRPRREPRHRQDGVVTLLVVGIGGGRVGEG